MSETVVLGIGNILLSDEGLGVRLVEELQKRGKLPRSVGLGQSGHGFTFSTMQGSAGQADPFVRLR